MDKKILTVSFIFLIYLTSNCYSQQKEIHFEFDSARVTGTPPNQYLEFDIMASATQSTQFKVAQLYLTYDTLGFGKEPIVEVLFAQDSSELLWPVVKPGNEIGNYSFSAKINRIGILAIQNIWYKTGSGSHTGYELSNQLSETPKRYAHLRMAIKNVSGIAGIGFVNSLINKGNQQHYYFTGGNDKSVYSGISYGPSINIPLSVELNSFTAEVSIKAIILNWHTETEVNNFGFEIESAPISLQKDKTEKNFKKIGFVAGSGNSNSPKKYSYLVEGIKYGKYAYRLKQIDNDGTYAYSKTIEVNAGEIPNGFILEQNYPNPFNPVTKIRFASSENKEAKLVIYDILGNEVAELFNNKLEANRVYEIEFNAANLASGVYIYAIRADKVNQIKKMLLLK